jgi:hypothetical protein
MGNIGSDAGFNQCSNALGTRGMSQSSRQKPFFGPTAIAVHDDADVLWKRIRSQLNSLIKRQTDSTTSCQVKKAAISGLLGFSIQTSSN